MNMASREAKRANPEPHYEKNVIMGVQGQVKSVFMENEKKFKQSFWSILDVSVNLPRHWFVV